MTLFQLSVASESLAWFWHCLQDYDPVFSKVSQNPGKRVKDKPNHFAVRNPYQKFKKFVLTQLISKTQATHFITFIMRILSSETNSYLKYFISPFVRIKG